MESILNYISITDANFNEVVLKNSRIMLVLFMTDWSGACHILAPVIDRLASDYSPKIDFGKMNPDYCKLIPHKFGVLEAPTLLLFYRGQVIDRCNGVVSLSHLEDKLKSALKEHGNFHN